jgi:hypothetical protein
MKYFLKRFDGIEKEVTKTEYVNAERQSNFWPKGEDKGQIATSGFSSSSTGMSGRVVYEDCDF